MPEDAVELPIFELPLAIVPAERVSLHIFEERYRAMIGASLEHGTPFGILYRDDDAPRTIGCTALVADVVERYDDGRLDIICRGGEPFRVLERFDAAEWPAASVEMIALVDPEPELTEELAAARAAFAGLLEAVGADAARADAAAGAYVIAGQIEMPPGEKQHLLETDDERRRLISLEGSLRRLLAGLKRSREIAERAKTNGHGPGPIGPIRPT
jgi:Lon protease-like protein